MVNKTRTKTEATSRYGGTPRRRDTHLTTDVSSKGSVTGTVDIIYSNTWERNSAVYNVVWDMQIYALRQLCEREKSLCLSLVDLEKMHDTVDRKGVHCMRF